MFLKKIVIFPSFQQIETNINKKKNDTFCLIKNLNSYLNVPQTNDL